MKLKMKDGSELEGHVARFTTGIRCVSFTIDQDDVLYLASQPSASESHKLLVQLAARCFDPKDL